MEKWRKNRLFGGGIQFLSFLQQLVQPFAKKSGWNGIKEGLIQLHLNALPFENRANQEFVCFLASCFKIPASKVNIVRGQKARIKTIEIENLNDVQWQKLLNN